MLRKYDDIKLISLDALTYAGNLENLKDVEDDPRHVYVKGDIRDKKLVRQLIAQYDPDFVVNFAAESHVDCSIADPEISVSKNISGTVKLLQCCKDEYSA